MNLVCWLLFNVKRGVSLWKAAASLEVWVGIKATWNKKGETICLWVPLQNWERREAGDILEVFLPFSIHA